MPDVPGSLLAKDLEPLALYRQERLLASGRRRLTKYELRDKRPRRGQIPRCENLRRDKGVVVLQRRSQALRLKRCPYDELKNAL